LRLTITHSPDLASPEATAGATQGTNDRTLRVELPTDAARLEIVTYQAATGGILGGVACLTFVQGAGATCAPGVALGAFALGAGAFGTAAYLLTSTGVRPGQATLIDSASTWGAYNGAMLAVALQSSPTRDFPLQLGAGIYTGLAIGLAGGTLVSVLAPFRLTEGHVALMNSAGLWSGAIGFLLSLPARSNGGQGYAIGQLVSVNLGLAAGLIAGAYLPVSRLRMLVVDAGTLAGLLLGLGIGYVASPMGSPGFETALGVMGAIGTASGFALSMVLSQRMDDGRRERERSAPRIAVAPSSPDGRPGVTAAVAF
jgi:hypothetical protein